MTNGDVIKTMFPDVEVKEKNNGYEVYFGVGTAIQFFNHQWWNAPYKEIEQQPCENVTYICDGKKCPECSTQCRHTTDISHAKNFKPVMSIDGETILGYEEVEDESSD